MTAQMLRTSSDAQFDVCGPLPEAGITVLEASAGTGKTFAIAALAARYVARGVPIPSLLLVTFTRMATGELRERVRDRLVRAEDGLHRALNGVVPGGDAVLELLATGSPSELEERRRRLARALTDFDAATIATTHGFCDEVLRGLGIAGDAERDITFVEDVGGIVEEVVDDFYLRKYSRRGAERALTRREALEVASAVVANPMAVVEPHGDGDTRQATARRHLAVAVRQEVERRKRRAGVMTYDDILIRLRTALAGGTSGSFARERLRSRFGVVMVDEFQDTDPVQWDIMRMAFGPPPDGGDGGGGADGEPTLVLIGDPKQAIYAFRGADVYAYLDAAAHADARATLDTNWRSDKGLLDAYDALFAGARLGHEGIPYRPMGAAAAHRTPRLVGAPVAEPLRMRVVARSDGLVELTAKGWLGRQSAQRHVAADLAADVVRLLRSGAQIDHHGGGTAPRRDDAEVERVRPRHVAVLVRTRYQAADVHAALEAVGVPAVLTGAGSVFGEAAAREWLRFLEALERPAARGRAASAALTAFVGWTAEQVAAADDARWETLHAELHEWAGVLRQRGVAALFEAVSAAEAMARRVLATRGGERRLTDLRHAGELLHAVAAAEQLGVTALTGWLRQRIVAAPDEAGDDERSRRLESDAEAVQILTIHRSKGLEFPVVYFPYLWDESSRDSGSALPIFHDPDAGDRRAIDVGGRKRRAFLRSQQLALAEDRGEELRLAYVALTRAQHQAVVWWAATWQGRSNPLTRLLLARDGVGNIAPEVAEPPADADVEAALATMAERVPGAVSIERSSSGAGEVWSDGGASAVTLDVARFGRSIDTQWRRTSYSGITAGAHAAPVGSEPEHAGVTDEAGPSGTSGGKETADGGDAFVSWRATASPLATMRAGADVGTLVHSVLSASDFSAADLDAELAGHLAREQVRQRVDAGDPAVVVAGLRAAIETPLGSLVGGARLRDVATPDRVDEMGFELPLAGGDTATGDAAVVTAEIGALLRRHLPPGDPFLVYAESLDDPALLTDLRGYLTGSIDLVLRVTAASGDAPRFAVVDYKTNRLGADGEPLTAWHYRPAAMAAEMERSHYTLQALLYLTALHRYLRWRLPGYDPSANLAGVLYLFLRGMAGAEAPNAGGETAGVVAWRPPAALVVALSDLFDGGGR